MPLILGEDARTMAVAARLQQAGFDIRGIRPPTVPAGTSRLRISLTLNATPADVDALAATLKEFSDMPRFVVTGTDTGIGKTVFSAAGRRPARITGSRCNRAWMTGQTAMPWPAWRNCRRNGCCPKPIA
jgi:hypothetical protein